MMCHNFQGKERQDSDSRQRHKKCKKETERFYFISFPFIYLFLIHSYIQIGNFRLKNKITK